MSESLTEQLAFTQDMRKKMVNHITEDGKKMPDKSGDIRVINEVLSGMDSAAIANARLELDGKQMENDAKAVETIASILTQHNNGRNGVVVKELIREVPVLTKDVPDPVLVTGETEISPPELEYDDFVISDDSD